MGDYLRPSELADALSALRNGHREILAGGTDFYPARVGRPLDDDVLDITDLDCLRGIVDRGDSHWIGALTSWTEIVEGGLPPWFEGLRLAALEVGGRQIQNAGTIGGNICNASPAADGIPPLLTLDARVEIASAGGTRAVPIVAFIAGNRRTVLAPDELVTGLIVPKPANPARATFVKVGARKYLVISIVMVAAVIEEAANGTVAAARIAVGACSEVARRLPELEANLRGHPLDDRLNGVVAPDHFSTLAPIDDIRADAAYRKDAAFAATRRALAALAGATA